ncbi:MAG: hypothetical protein JW839_15330 [Candidatus Lokiarchaeota archaeon]|nr:hypothetical protein [Candidatus Lokiarchaeota archaeon]
MQTFKERGLYFLVKILVLVFLVPILVGSVMFTRVFSSTLRKTLKARGLNEVQRVLNWKGIAGIFELARGAK